MKVQGVCLTPPPLTSLKSLCRVNGIGYVWIGYIELFHFPIDGSRSCYLLIYQLI